MEVGDDNSLIFDTREDEDFLRALIPLLEEEGYLLKSAKPEGLIALDIDSDDVDAHTAEELRDIMAKVENSTVEALDIRILPPDQGFSTENERLRHLRDRVMKKEALRRLHQPTYLLDKTWLPIVWNGSAMLMGQLSEAEDKLAAIRRNDPSSSIFAGKSDEEIEEIIADAEQMIEEDGVDAYAIAGSVHELQTQDDAVLGETATKIALILFKKYMLGAFGDDSGLYE